MTRIRRRILWHTYLITQAVYRNFSLAIVGVLRHFWPDAVFFRWVVLDHIGMKMVDKGRLEKAKRVADELIDLSSRFCDTWNYGNAMHKANLILGRAALREGNLDTAKHYLLCAGKTPGSPQLDTFGPNMSLAKELLRAGEKEAVLAYFVLCQDFWDSEYAKSTLRLWTQVVQKGGIPSFGPNLHY